MSKRERHSIAYVAVVGINWLDAPTGQEQRAEPGEPVPASVVERSPWLREQGLVRRVDGPDERVEA